VIVALASWIFRIGQKRNEGIECCCSERLFNTGNFNLFKDDNVLLNMKEDEEEKE
jgi:hypothetical protein